MASSSICTLTCYSGLATHLPLPMYLQASNMEAAGEEPDQVAAYPAPRLDP